MTRLGDSEGASTSGFDDELLANYGKLEGYNLLSLSSLPPGIYGKRNNQENGSKFKYKSELGDESGNSLPQFCRRDMGSLKTTKRNGSSSLRSRSARAFSIKPVNSLESCLIAQMYKERMEMDEYVFSAHPSPVRERTMRPLIVTDGNQVTSRASCDSYSLQLKSGESKFQKDNEFYSDGKEMVLGVPSLPEVGPVERKQKRGKGRVGRLSCSKTKSTCKNVISQVSSSSADGMFLFCLGISVGVILTLTSNRKEVDKLNGLLKQTENLVQDLQEELEMKDSMTVKELPNEDYDSEKTKDNSFHNSAPTTFSSEFSSLNYDVKRLESKKPEPEEDSEFMSKIEAELEAELERLEMNMQASSLDGRLSGADELDPDLVGNIVQGELRANMIKGGVRLLSGSDEDTSGTSTTRTENMNRPVSPRELSLRLHEVIQSRLEERVLELECELENSQKRLNLAESKQTNSRKNFSNSKIGSSSQDSMTMEERNPVVRPLFLDLGGDSLDAYNEVYDEFTKVPGTDEDEVFTPLKIHNSISSNVTDKEKLHSLGRNIISSVNRDDIEENISTSIHVKMMEERDRKLLLEKMRAWERFSSSRGSNEVDEFQEENGDDEEPEEEEKEDDEDEIGRLLIKQIVEKTRQGSPVVLNAQKLLFSLDDRL